MNHNLPYGLAKACEYAEGPRCRCRCGGALHGAARARPYELPEDDPHFVHEEHAQEQTSILEDLLAIKLW